MRLNQQASSTIIAEEPEDKFVATNCLLPEWLFALTPSLKPMLPLAYLEGSSQQKSFLFKLLNEQLHSRILTTILYCKEK